MNDKKSLIYIVCAGIIPIILIIIAICIKEGGHHKITQKTYVHVFYADECVKCKETEKYLNELNLPFTPVYHNVKNQDELRLYDKVISYFNLESKLTLPFLVVNNKYLKDFDNEEISSIINSENEIYAKDNLSKEEIDNYNIVDQISLAK